MVIKFQGIKRNYNYGFDQNNFRYDIDTYSLNRISSFVFYTIQGKNPQMI